MDNELLTSLMKQHKDTNETLAEYLGIAPCTLSYKRNGTKGRDFNLGEMRAIIERYSLTPAQVERLFFN